MKERPAPPDDVPGYTIRNRPAPHPQPRWRAFAAGGFEFKRRYRWLADAMFAAREGKPWWDAVALGARVEPFTPEPKKEPAP